MVWKREIVGHLSVSEKPGPLRSSTISGKKSRSAMRTRVAYRVAGAQLVCATQKRPFKILLNSLSWCT